MTREELLRLRALAEETSRKVEAIRDGLATAIDAPESPSETPALPSRAILTLGPATGKAGQQVSIYPLLTCPEPIAGVWLNIRHSPRLTFTAARAIVKARAFRVEKGPSHFRALIMFSTDLESGSAQPGSGLVQLDPETPLLEAHYTLPADAVPGQKFVVQAGRSGISGEGRTTSWPTLLLNWGSGGFEPEVEDSYIEVVA